MGSPRTLQERIIEKNKDKEISKDVLKKLKSRQEKNVERLFKGKKTKGLTIEVDAPDINDTV
jgi:hypothetical protein